MKKDVFLEIDQPFKLKIPDWEKLGGGVVLYHFQLIDTIMNRNYQARFRFREIKEIYKSLKGFEKVVKLPEFPKTSPLKFWSKTNEDPVRIQQRKEQLQIYFMSLVNHPIVRGTIQVKSFINLIKRGNSQTYRSKSVTNYGVSDALAIRRYSDGDGAICLEKWGGEPRVVRRIK